MAKIDFLGKGDVAGHHLSVPFRTLQADKEKSVGVPDLDGNLIIHGDNLLALKALLPRYQGKVKCVYIDPPYNTGNEGWCYNDKVNSPMMKEWFEKNVSSDDQTRHDKWLCMMYPRLQLLKELLSEDGVIFISIDDNEQHRFRMIMDEIFGEVNFIANIIWHKKNVVQNDARFLSTNHDLILCYKKDTLTKFNLLERTGEQIERYSNPDNDPRGQWQSVALHAKGGSGSYKIVFPNGVKWTPPPGTHPRLRKDRLLEVYNEGRLWFGNKGKNVPRLKKYLAEVQDGSVSSTIWDNKKVGSTQGAKEMLKTIMENNLFDTPKPVQLINRILRLTTDKNDIILDSFAGSGTTAHAVLALNKEDGGNRKFILVECEEKIAREITAERVRRVIKGVPKTKDENLKKGFGSSFTFATLGDEIDHEKLLSGKSMPSWTVLARHVFWLATGKTLDREPKPNKNFLVGRHQNNSVYLLYEPDVKFLQSNKAALTGDVADKLRNKKKPGERILYYAAASYVSQKDMQNSGITFCQLPWAVTKQVRK